MNAETQMCQIQEKCHRTTGTAGSCVIYQPSGGRGKVSLLDLSPERSHDPEDAFINSSNRTSYDREAHLQ
jgi:hypothetical protein